MGLCARVVVLLLALGAAQQAGASDARAAAALRAGRAAELAGKPARAAALFAEAARYELVAHHAARLEARAWLAAGRAKHAAQRAGALRARYRGRALTGELARLEAEARAALGDEAGARRAWSAALGATRKAAARAELLAAQARSWQRSGEPAKAGRAWLQIWRSYPQTPQGAQAEQALAKLEAVTGPLRAAPAALFERCEALFAARLNAEALRACADAAQSAAGAAARRESLRRRARTLFRMRAYKQAVRAFSELDNGRSGSARLWRARALARSGRGAESIAIFESLGAGGGERGARALLLASTLVREDGPRFTRWLRRVAASAPRAEQRADAHWRLGWAAWRAGQFRAARAAFEAMLKEQRDPLEALRGRYWRARSLSAGGDSQAGRAALGEIARRYPFTYYGWRAQQLLRGAAGKAGGAQSEAAARPGVAAQPGAAKSRAAAKPKGAGAANAAASGTAASEAKARTAGGAQSAAGGRSALPSQPRRLIRVLLDAGLHEEAAWEVDALRRQARRRADRLLLAQLYQEAERYHAAQELILGSYLLDLARGPDPMRAPLSLWRSAWPTAYAEEVAAATAQRRVPPQLLWAVVREESGYRPSVVSISGARGLAQIMPATGRQLARELGQRTFHADELFEPARNLELAVHYLESLLARFDGRTAAAVASYNAGPGAVARWLRENGALADDEWVEAIPYAQTRGYVRRVLRSVQVYQALY